MATCSRVWRFTVAVLLFSCTVRAQYNALSGSSGGSLLNMGMGIARNLIARPAVQDVIERVQYILDNGLDTYTKNSTFDVSPTCLNHTELMLQALMNQEKWALRMIDAMGKPPSELMNYQLTWLGSYDECIATDAIIYNNVTAMTTSPFSGKYCKSAFGLGNGSPMGLMGSPALKIGICVPDSCSGYDANGLVKTLVSLIPLNTSMLDEPTTQCQEDLELSDNAIAMIAMCGVFLAVMIMGTTYDLVISHCLGRTTSSQVDPLTKYRVPTANGDVSKNGDIVHVSTSFRKFDSDKTDNGHVITNGVMERKPKLENIDLNTDIEKPQLVEMETTPYKSGIIGKLLLSFSVYTNAGKIMNVRQSSGALTAVNGMRFLGMTWVMLGHVYFFAMPLLGNAATFVPEMMKRLTFQAILNATFAVDTFFSLSGLLVAYLSLKEMQRVGGAKKFRWGMYYFHRFWRLTPPYILLMMVWALTMRYWNNGPLWHQGGNDCHDSWWRNLLYINNLYKPLEKDCMGWAWYLANDMQFFVVSPLMLIPLYYSPIWGGICCLAFILANFITSGVISARGHMSANIFFGLTDADQYEELYVKPYCRIGPYVVGIFTGYLLYRTKCKIKMPKIVNCLGWTVATAMALLTLYGIYNSDGGAPSLSNELTALYNATSRTAWGVCVCWVVFACATGYGGPVNALLSWPGVIPLSRLTYCAYLVHPVVMDFYYFSRRTLVISSDIEIIYSFLGFTCVTYIVAFVMSLAFEAPMMGLEKVILKRDKSN